MHVVITTDEYVQSLSGWQHNNLEAFRKMIHDCAPEIAEEIKWNVPVFLLNGKMVFSMAAFKTHTKYNFIANGALLDDPHSLFNNGLESKKSRSVDLAEGDAIDSDHLKKLIQQAIDKL